MEFLKLKSVVFFTFFETCFRPAWKWKVNENSKNVRKFKFCVCYPEYFLRTILQSGKIDIRYLWLQLSSLLATVMVGNFEMGCTRRVPGSTLLLCQTHLPWEPCTVCHTQTRTINVHKQRQATENVYSKTRLTDLLTWQNWDSWQYKINISLSICL